MLIRSYGLFWHRAHIEWGAGGRKGHLRGYWEWRKRGGEVDFREQRGVYVLYDSSFRMVYVGQSGRGVRCLFSRLKDHRKDHLAHRWSRFSWFGTRGVAWDKKDRPYLAEDEDFTPRLSDVLNHIEGILIAAAEPPLNRQGSKFGSDVYHFKQVKKPGVHDSE